MLETTVIDPDVETQVAALDPPDRRQRPA
jgi:hypothetical protein